MIAPLVYCNVRPRPHPVAVIGQRITHGRHCICSACAREDWTQPQLAPCGIHGPSCPREYQPLGAPGDVIQGRCVSCGQPVKATT